MKLLKDWCEVWYEYTMCAEDPYTGEPILYDAVMYVDYNGIDYPLYDDRLEKDGNYWRVKGSNILFEIDDDELYYRVFEN